MDRFIFALLSSLFLSYAASASPLASLEFARGSDLLVSDTGIIRFYSKMYSVDSDTILIWQFDQAIAFSGATPTSTTDFTGFLAGLTNGVDDKIWVSFGTQSLFHPAVFALTGGVEAFESSWLGNTNLEGASIDSATLAWDPNAGAYGTASILFSGSTIPEPSTALLVGMGLAVIAARRSAKVD